MTAASPTADPRPTSGPGAHDENSPRGTTNTEEQITPSTTASISGDATSSTATSMTDGADKKALCQQVWRSKSLADKDRFFSRGRPLPIDEGLAQINMDPDAASPADLVNED